MLQFLVADYLAGYGLHSLRKTVTKQIKITWTLTVTPNTYALTSHVPEKASHFVDPCRCNAVAIRIDSDNPDVVISLLEDGSERVVGAYRRRFYRKAGILSDYLIEGE
jgi:hypothetical protein